MTFRIAPIVEGPNPLYWFTVDELLSEANVPISPDASYQDFAEVVKNLGRGSFGRGFPIARWHFDLLTAGQYMALRNICPGTSARVYIETPTNEFDMSGNEVWITAQAVMNWPEGEPDRDVNGVTLDSNFEFTEIVEV